MNEVHTDGAAALGDDGNRPDGLDVVEASRGNKVCLDTLDELMRTGNDERLQDAAKTKAPKTPILLYRISITPARTSPIRLPSGPNTVNRATLARIRVTVGTKTNETTSGMYFWAIFSTLAINQAVRIAGNTPPWKATMGMESGPKFQYSAPVGSITNVLRFIRLG